MKYLEMTNEERRLPVLRRAVPSVARRTATTVAVCTAGVLAAAVVGWFSAGAAGPAASAGDALAGALAGALAPERSAETDWAEPAMRRTIDLSAPPPTPAPQRVPEPSLPHVSPPVQQGAPCPAEGDTGVTRSGDAAVCTASPDDGRPRWRLRS